MFILALAVGGIAILPLQPLSILTCRYVETKQVNCQLQERVAWVIPVQRIPITHLKESYVKKEAQIRKDENEKEYTVSVYRVVLVGASDEIVLKGYEETGIFANLTTAQINGYLNTPTDESLTVWGYGLWGHTLITLAGGLWFILFTFTFVMAVVSMVFGPNTVAKLLKV